MKRSGVNEHEKIRLVTALFNERNVQQPKEDVRKVRKRFKYFEAWEVLRGLRKYSAVGEASPSNIKSGTTTGFGSTAVSGREANMETPAKCGG